MTPFLHKRTITFIALVMAMAILAPSMIKLGHALHGHNSEQKCISYGKDHIHSSDIDCDFHDFALASKILFSSQFVYTPVEVPDILYANTYLSVVFESSDREQLALRGPPVIS